jgi:ClpP class serine protease
MPRGDFIKADLLNQAFILCPAKMQTYMNVLSEGAIRTEEIGVANNNVVYTVVDNVAIIAIDGAMYKKEFRGACGESVVAYPNIIKAINIAEADNNINTILFRVDTGGGSVAGAEEVRFRIKNSPKKTITFYENLGASGGIWIFTASDEIYAAPTTWLGSIGVVVAYEEEDPETKNKKIELVSKNAPNKRCSTNGDCKEKMQLMIDEIEKDFFMVLEENTGFKQEQLVEIFQNGGIIKAEIAKEKGFIKDIRQFSVLLGDIKSNKGVRMPGTSPDDNSANVENKPSNTLIGGLIFNEDNFTMLVESRNKLNETIKALNEQVEVLSKNNDVVAEYETFKTNAENRLSLSMSFGVSQASAIKDVIFANTDEEATKVALDWKEKNTQLVEQNEAQNTTDAVDAYFESKRKEREYK